MMFEAIRSLTVHMGVTLLFYYSFPNILEEAA